jgi:methylmalonyl-CoA mutase
MTEQAFAALFPVTTHDDWRLAVDSVLKGAAFETLQRVTYDGITINPLYPRVESHPIIGRAAGEPWSISQLVDMQDANNQVLEDLEGGATALTLQITPRYGFAMGDLKAALKGVYLELIPIRVDNGNEKVAGVLEPLAKGLDTHIALGFDPISNNQPVEAFPYKLGSLFMADGRGVHDAGGSEAQELAYVLASGVAYVRAGGSLSFLLSADQDQYLTTAKFRAMRLLWAKVEAAFGVMQTVIDLHAETSWRMMTKTDAAVNWLRITTAVFAAGVGGANHITVLPRSLPFGLPDAFDRRMARNMQLVLLEESGLAAVSDPASGAGGIEALTDALCEKAWGIFQTIEAKGGIVEAKEWLIGEVAKTAALRLEDIQSGKQKLTGTTVFKNKNDVIPQVLQEYAHETRFLAVVEG